MTTKTNIQLLNWWLSELQKLTQKVMKSEDSRVERLKRKYKAELSEYSSLDDIREAYGFGAISEKKYERLCDMWENSHVDTSELYEAQLNLLQELYQESKSALESLKREVK